MCGLLARCAALILMIHGFRALGKVAGPRWSGLALGLPSTTAIVLIFCGCEHGSAAATTMAEASLLGLVAAVALPLAYAHTARRGWPLPAVLAAAVAAYIGVATGLGHLPPLGVLERLAIASAALFAAAHGARRIPVPASGRPHDREPLCTLRTVALRTAIPTLYVLFLAAVERLAGTGWAGLLSTFPSISLVVLLVTYLEAGPAQSTRIALVLPAGNTSTAAFLAAFRVTCPQVGLSAGIALGYLAALLVLLAIEGFVRCPDVLGSGGWSRSLRWPQHRTIWRIPTRADRPAAMFRVRANAPTRGASPFLIRGRMHHRGRFSPLVETLAW
jgi:hypothetical protein